MTLKLSHAVLALSLLAAAPALAADATSQAAAAGGSPGSLSITAPVHGKDAPAVSPSAERNAEQALAGGGGR